MSILTDDVVLSHRHGGAAFGAFAAGLGHGQRQHQRRAALGAEGGEPRHGAVAMPGMGIPWEFL